jgi:hypothetical protein
MKSTDEFTAYLMELALASSARSSWLAILPASGTVLRMNGALLFVEVGGETGWSPFIVNPESGKAMAIDPRALIVHDKTLQVGYHPREYIDRVHKASGEWFAQNPDVFRPEIKSMINKL